MSSPFLKDPGDRVDYLVDYTDWLGTDTITGTPSWTVPTGLTNYAVSNTTTGATIWLTGGTHGNDYTVTCQVTTTGGRIKQQSFTIKVRDNVA
ncbi:MAG: hypothetical protein K8U57_30450 [Planctomycetes bacterium]|nr:hypothetical protein [Planctomycetota bacterium]